MLVVLESATYPGTTDEIARPCWKSDRVCGRAGILHDGETAGECLPAREHRAGQRDFLDTRARPTADIASDPGRGQPADADHRVTETVGLPAGLGAVAQAERGLPPVPLNVVGEITSLVTPPAPAQAYGREVGMREKGVRIKVRNRSA